MTLIKTLPKGVFREVVKNRICCGIDRIVKRAVDEGEMFGHLLINLFATGSETSCLVKVIAH